MKCAVCSRESGDVVCWRCTPRQDPHEITADLISDAITEEELMWTEPTPVDVGAPEQRCA